MARERAAERRRSRAEASAAEASAGEASAGSVGEPKQAVAPAKKSSGPGTLPDIGEDAPTFSLLDEADIEHQLADYRGQKLLVWFYPKADTPGCTLQGCGLRDEFKQFEDHGVAVLGVSFDDARANTNFRTKHRFPFPLLCDQERSMAIAYGAADDAKAAYARRIAVLIDERGKVVKSWDRVNPRSFAAEALAALPQSQR